MALFAPFLAQELPSTEEGWPPDFVGRLSVNRLCLYVGISGEKSGLTWRNWGDCCTTVVSENTT